MSDSAKKTTRTSALVHLRSGHAADPVSNDGLILIGIPLLYPYAWFSFATMCLATERRDALRAARIFEYP